MTEYEIQNLIISGCGAIATFLAVLVALFGKRAQDWIDRPKMRVSYWQESERCFRGAMQINDRIQNFPHIPLERQFFRLRVSNEGKQTARRVKVVVDLYYENGEPAERFEPNSLRWIASDQETIDIASQEKTYINLLSQITKIKQNGEKIPSNLFVIRWEVFNMMPRGIAWDRESRDYLIKLIIHGDNFEPSTKWLKFIPDKNDIFAVGSIKYCNNDEEKNIVKSMDDVYREFLG